jgi:streptogramin lyase
MCLAYRAAGAAVCDDPTAWAPGQPRPSRTKEGGVVPSPACRVIAVVACVVGIALAVAAPASAQAPGTVTEIALSAGSDPYGITAGPDGNLWFTERSFGQVGRVTPDGTVTIFSAGITDRGLRGITAGPDGNLWFTEGHGGIGRITPTGTVTEFPIPSGGDPYGITVGPDGNLWFTELDGTRIGRITPTGTVTEFSAGISAGSRPYDIVAGPDGNLWFTELRGDRIGRITTTGTVTEFPVTPGSKPYGMTVGPDGALWFVERGADRIGRMTLTGVVTEYSAGISPGANPLAIAAGPDGNVWFTEFNGNRVARITPAGVVTEFPVVTAGSQPYGIVAAADDLWFTQRAAGRIGRITPPPPPPPPPVPPAPPAPSPAVADDRCSTVAVVYGIAPASGPSGSEVTISGDGFACTTGVLFGGMPALGFSIDGAGRITARAPVRGPGDVDVRVLTRAGASAVVPGDRFSFTATLVDLGVVPEQPVAPGESLPPKALRCGRVPTLIGYTRAQARRVLARDRCDARLRLRGKGPRRGHRRVTSQVPEPGTPLYIGDPDPTVRFG